MQTIRNYLMIFLYTSITGATSLFSQKQYTVEKLPFCSSQFDEFAPTYYNDGIVFCANYKNSILVSFVDTSAEPHLLFDLYYTKSNRSGKKWQTPLLFNDLNTIFQEGPACFYDNYTKVVFTRNLYTGKTFGNYLKPGNRLGLFFAELSGKNGPISNPLSITQRNTT